MRISDWSSDVCSSDLARLQRAPVCSDLGFALGPRINAGGRVGKSDLGVRLLTTEDPEEARAIAMQLNILNEERRAIEAAVQDAAEAMTRSEEHTSELQSLMRNSYAAFCLKKKNKTTNNTSE